MNFASPKTTSENSMDFAVSLYFSSRFRQLSLRTCLSLPTTAVCHLIDTGQFNFAIAKCERCYNHVRQSMPNKPPRIARVDFTFHAHPVQNALNAATASDSFPMPSMVTKPPGSKPRRHRAAKSEVLWSVSKLVSTPFQGYSHYRRKSVSPAHHSGQCTVGSTLHACIRLFSVPALRIDFTCMLESQVFLSDEFCSKAFSVAADIMFTLQRPLRLRLEGGGHPQAIV